MAADAVGTFGGRDLAALVFLGVAIIGIWVAFRRLPD